MKPWSHDWLIDAEAYTGFCSMQRLRVFLLPLDRIVVHRWPLPRNLLRFPTICRYPFILLGGERHCESQLSCPRTQHSVPETARSGNERTNHEATAPSPPSVQKAKVFNPRLDETFCIHCKHFYMFFEKVFFESKISRPYFRRRPYYAVVI